MHDMRDDARTFWTDTLIAILAMAIIGAAAWLLASCSPQVGPTDGPALQVGSPERPAVEAPVDADVAIASPDLAPDQVNASGRLDVDSRTITSQPADQDANAGDQCAGRDNKPVGVNLNLSGSGWPLVAAIAAIVAALGLVLYLRERRRATAVESSRHTLERNATSVARSIEAMGPGPQRDKLLELIEGHLVDRQQWDQVITPFRVRRGSSLEGNW
jgi:hypothetical protein